jgi:hypothetical protein
MDTQIAKRHTFVGLFLITLATLMYEILLTRIFSVTMWYHFAFMVISVALFGMTFGAILVYALPNYFTQERTKKHLAQSSLWFAMSIVLSFLTHASIPFVTDPSFIMSPVWLFSVAITYVVISVPFVFSGIAVSLALTRFPKQVSKLYAADLAGAAIGCIFLIYTLNMTDGPTAVILVAGIASLGSLFFAAEASSKQLTRIATAYSLLFALLAVVNALGANNQSPLIRLMWVKGELEQPPLYEKWNSFSRIRVFRDPLTATKPFGWGLSATYTPNHPVQQLSLNIDANAGTVLTQFDGDPDNLDYLKYDVTNLAHYIRQDADVLAIGSGGGRDVLSALVFDQESVLGIEMNQDIINSVNGRFGEFTGHLDQNPKVTFVADEARSYIARSTDHFDIIQVSLIDTWAATAAGAFVLSENSLYTVEAWQIFLDHLTPDGVLTFSRWYFRDRPGEMYRLTSLASAALMDQGIENPRDHMIIVRNMQRGEEEDQPDGVGTILVSKQPFSNQDLDIMDQVVSEKQFDLVLTPGFSLDDTFATIASGKDFDAFVADYPINITPPTDDSPFFFHMLRFGSMFNQELWKQGATSFNMVAVAVLGALLIIVLFLTALCIIGPLFLTTKRETLQGTLPLFTFFSGIGLGFMLVEISQIQRLNIFLGHPTYGLSVGLFGLLLSSGIGSYSTQRIGNPSSAGSGSRRLLLLILVLGALGVVTPQAIAAFEGSTTMVRILVALAILFPMGLFMGMAFPLGMRLASTRWSAVTPWFWGVNGATSVCASVLAVVIAISISISASFWAGLACYVIAISAFVWISRKITQSS